MGGRGRVGSSPMGPSSTSATASCTHQIECYLLELFKYVTRTTIVVKILKFLIAWLLILWFLTLAFWSCSSHCSDVRINF